MILARVAALPAATQSFLAAASVLGQHAPSSAIVSVAGLPDARHEVDAAVAAGLLTEGASASELAFTHPLYRAAIYADLSPTSRRELHARAAEPVAGRARLAHRVAASLGPDEALAGELEASALASAAAGDAGASAWAWNRRRPCRQLRRTGNAGCSTPPWSSSTPRTRLRRPGSWLPAKAPVPAATP